MIVCDSPAGAGEADAVPGGVGPYIQVYKDVPQAQG